VCLHGFMDTWRTWELVLPTLERHHDVLAPTLAGHAGGPPIGARPSLDAALAALERQLDDAGFERAHLVGNSLGGFLALRLAARGRALSVVALAPAGGRRADDPRLVELLEWQRSLHAQVKAAAPTIDASLSTAEGRRRATRLITCRSDHIPAELIDHLVRGIAACPSADALVDAALDADWSLDAARIECPVRIVWGTADALLPWPDAAVRYRDEWLPHADWVVLDGVGHCPQLDVPLETAQLVLGHTG
jgi:pimeloyl-ACP methyl ester carboxylesterase